MRHDVQRQDVFPERHDQRRQVAAAVGDRAHMQRLQVWQRRQALSGSGLRVVVDDRHHQHVRHRHGRQRLRQFIQQIGVEHMGHHAYAQLHALDRGRRREHNVRWRRRRYLRVPGVAQAPQKAWQA
ncbi:hypothetical protein GGR77_003270 [Xanthomonas translucens]